MENEIVLFETADKKISLNVKMKQDTVWLTRNQIAELFDRDVKTIGKHINNALSEEVDLATVAKFATLQKEGERVVERKIEHYNLEMIVSVGYRVKSHRGIEFRRWANSVLKQYILQGYAVNNNRINQLGEVIRIMKRTENSLDSRQVLSVIEKYNEALELLDSYDHQTMKRPTGNNIYQSFAGQELYPTMEEKAAHLLYFITKNHSFYDGNKRIAAAMFLYFLDKNGVLFADGNKLIDDHTLVALTIMIAESRPEEMEMMITVVMNCIK